ncbi:hypothetical protein GZH78_19020 [Pseudomonas fluorescens]|nr:MULTISPECIES: hypothetical protein [Pseudomonas]MBP3997955.1 hypothetical protein [Pseudomonas koreensis]QIA04152.1 hypothetical protein GZH78_19020 [Pseudomonas fluorescens]
MADAHSIPPRFILHETEHWILNHHMAFGSLENAQTATDGAELTLFIWREFGESPTPPAIQGASIKDVTARLRLALK